MMTAAPSSPDAAWHPDSPVSSAAAAAASTCHRWRWCTAEHTSPPWEHNGVVSHHAVAIRDDLVTVLVEHEGRDEITVLAGLEGCDDEEPQPRADYEDPYVSLSVGGGYLHLPAPLAARLRDALAETRGGAEWLTGPLAQALSLLGLGSRSPAEDHDLARVIGRYPGLSRRAAAHLLDRWQRAAARQ